MFGAHNAAAYVRSAALQTSFTSIVHDFLKVDDKPSKFQPGGPGHELVYGASAIVPYLKSLTPEDDLVASFDAIAKHEQEILTPLLRFLTDAKQVDRGVRILGTGEINFSRIPTVCFVVVGQNAMKSKDIVEAFHKKGGVSLSVISFSNCVRLWVLHRSQFNAATSVHIILLIIYAQSWT